MTAEVEELVADLKRRADACRSLYHENRLALVDRSRLEGKEVAYRHAAELASALRSSGSGEGWVLVPREPTVAMKLAMRDEAQRVSAKKDPDTVGALAWNGLFLWKAMISASPKALKTGGE